MFGMSRKQWLGVALAMAVGIGLYFVFERSPLKAAALLTAAIVIDVAVDLVFTKAEKARGDID